MKLIITNSTEIKELSGFQYENNAYDKIKTDVILQTEELEEIVGADVIAKAVDCYERKDNLTDDEQTFLQAVQMPIAIGAAFRYNQSNLVSHDDTSRTVKVSKEHESIAWEWMIDKDDQAALRKLRQTTDRLIKIMEKQELTEWINSEKVKESRELFIPNTDTFSRYFNIDYSPTFYYRVQPIIREIQRNVIRPALGEDYTPLITNFKNNSIQPDQEELLEYVQAAIPLKVVGQAIRRHTLQFMPEGIVQGFKSFSQTQNASNTATQESLNWYLRHLDQDADYQIDLMKRYRMINDPDYQHRKLIPKNDPRKKYART